MHAALLYLFVSKKCACQLEDIRACPLLGKATECFGLLCYASSHMYCNVMGVWNMLPQCCNSPEFV